MRERRLILGVGAMFAVAVVAAFALDAFTSYRERLSAVERETRNMAALLADQARQLLTETDQTLRVAVLAYDDWLADPRGSAETGYRMLKSIQGGSLAVESLNWFDPKGDRIATSLAPDAPRINIRDREHFHVHTERADVGRFMSPPVPSLTRDQLISVVSRRIGGPRGPFAGVAVAVLDFSHLIRVLKRYHTLGNVKVSLYLRNGSYIAHYPNPESRMGRTNAHTRLFTEELPKADQGTYHGFADVSQEHRIFSYLAVEGYPLVVQVSMPRGIALAPWYNRIRLTGGFAILALIVAAVATGMIHRQARRLREERQKALEAQIAAEHASRSKSEFLAHMSHELRTPLNAVIGFSQMMSKEIFGPVGSPKYHEYLNDIATSGQHLLQVVNNVLDLAKVEAGKWEMQEEIVGVGELCLAATQIVRERARAAGVAIEIDRDSPAVAVRADPRLLRQILLNLVINSIKFTEPGGRIRLGWALRDDGALAIETLDTGVGMSAQDAKRVLEPFGHGSAHLARTRHETGLGLSLCKRFAEMHGGSLVIASEPGRGTMVTVTLPKERMAAPHEVAALQALAALQEIAKPPAPRPPPKAPNDAEPLTVR